MQTFLLVVHLIVAVLLIGAILMQRSEGGALGIGGGNSGGNLFSARGVGNGLTRATAILAVCFFATSIALTMLATKSKGPVTVFGQDQQAPATGGSGGGNGSSGSAPLPNLGQQQAPAAPAAPAQPAAPQVPTNN